MLGCISTLFSIEEGYSKFLILTGDSIVLNKYEITYGVYSEYY